LPPKKVCILGGAMKKGEQGNRIEKEMGKVRERNLKLGQLMFELFYDKTFRIAYFITRDATIAEDATHDAFVKAFENINQLRDASKLGPWLAAIAANQAKDVLRDRKRCQPISQPDVFADLGMVKTSSVEEIVEEIEEKATVQKLLRELSPEHFEVVILKYFYNLKCKEIADILGIRPGTVKSRLNRARQDLRKRLEPNEPFVHHKYR